MSPTERRNLRNGLLFASPYLIGFLAFTLYPSVASFYYSLCQFNSIFPPVWIGIENYINLFFNDPLFWYSLYNTLFFTFLSVPIGLGIAIVLAVLLNQKVKGLAVFRAIFFVPTIVPIVASSVLWLWLLNPDYGLVNMAIRAVSFGMLNGPGWLADPAWSKPALILMSFWSVGGAMVIFLAGLGEIPESLYEVADIDGAGPLLKFRHITIPMLTPTILFNLVMGLIGSFQYFTQAFVMTGGGDRPIGGPLDSTTVYALYMYKNAFFFLRMGYASALAWIMFFVILIVTVMVMKSSQKWVHYYGD